MGATYFHQNYNSANTLLTMKQKFELGITLFKNHVIFAGIPLS